MLSKPEIISFLSNKKKKTKIGNKIIYKRIVSIGDAFTTQPLFLSHPINKDSALFCTNTNKLNTDTINYKRPLICSSVEPTNILFSTLPHKNYMYVKFGANTLNSLLSLIIVATLKSLLNSQFSNKR